MPKRLQLSRRKGWRLPDGAVVVARPTRWGNPFRIGTPGIPDAATAVARFTAAFRSGELASANPAFDRETLRAELRGRDLACWCAPGTPCHADVLIEAANSPAG